MPAPPIADDPAAESGTLPVEKEQGMILVARIGGLEVVVEDEQPGNIPYTPEYLEDLAHRLGRQAVSMYDAIPAQPLVQDEAEDES